MKRTFKIAVVLLAVLGIAAATVLFFSTHSIAVLDPKGMIAEKQRDLLYTACWLMLIVVIPVLVMTLVFAWRYREGNEKAKYTPDWEHSHIAECLWWGVPFIIIIFLAVITWTSTHELSPYRPIDTDKKALRIQAISLNWKWLFIYPEQGIASLNFVEFPEKTPIAFEITSDGPMNSLWIPRLGGQIYAMSAMRTKLHLIANEQGSFRGSSSNFSGKGFSSMHFIAKAVSEEEFNQWVETAKSSSKTLDLATYNELAAPSERDPVAYYVLSDPELFYRIVRKYEPPAEDRN